MRPIAARLQKELVRLLKEGNRGILRHYDRSAPVNMDRATGEAVGSPPYLYQDIEIVFHRVETTRLKSSVLLDLPDPDQPFPTFRFFVKHDVVVQQGDIIFDPVGKAYSIDTDPIDAKWEVYQVRYVNPHSVGNEVVYNELVVARADYSHV